MSAIYTTVPVPRFPSNTFNLSREASGSMAFHKQYCTECIEVIPGDGFVAGSETFGRSEPMVAPPLAKQDCDHHSFFVPDWQLSDYFDDFITGGEKMDFSEHMPYVTVGFMYNLVDYLLDWNKIPSDLTPETPSSIVTKQLIQEVNYRTDLALRILEHNDWLRAVPFVKPDFLPPITYSASLDYDAIEDIMEANKDAFEALNRHLSDVSLRVNLLPFAAYDKVWCEFFRDENLFPDIWDFVCTNTDSNFYSSAGGFKTLLDSCDTVLAGMLSSLSTSCLAPVLDIATAVAVRSDLWQDYEFFALKLRAWRKDRYTASLPWTQKGPDILIPLAGTFDVENSPIQTSYQSVVYGGPGSKSTSLRMNISGTDDVISQHVDLSKNKGQGTTIRELREAFAAESWEESQGQFGNRYPESMLGQFGVHTPDSRLPRCQFLGSNTQNFVTSEVTQTSESGDTPQGNLAGKGTIYGSHRLFRGYYTQHGFIIVISSLRVRALYEQGIHPMFSRFDRTEYAWPRFARLGEQPLYVKELYVHNDAPATEEVTEDEVFGYVPRYSEYKTDTSSVHGLLKSSRNYWTFSRRFGSKPKLNADFIYGRPRLDAFAVINPYEDQFTVQINFYVRSRRKLPYWGTPII